MPDNQKPISSSHSGEQDIQKSHLPDFQYTPQATPLTESMLPDFQYTPPPPPPSSEPSNEE